MTVMRSNGEIPQATDTPDCTTDLSVEDVKPRIIQATPSEFNVSRYRGTCQNHPTEYAH